MKILIGVVPYGKNNVGDEAILATIVNSIRNVNKNAKITISTDDKNTEEKLNIKTIPLCGHLPNLRLNLFEKEIKKNDVLIWGGATGLSDYPTYALKLVKIAKKNKKKIILYSVGMNEKLKSALYELLPGRRMSRLKFFNNLCLNLIDFVKIRNFLVKFNVEKKIKNALLKVDLIIVRDKLTKVKLNKLGVKKVYYTADPAFLLNSSDIEQTWKKNKLWENKKNIIGIGISSQREIKQKEEMINFIDNLIQKYKAKVIFIPMNHITDYKVMRNLRNKLKHKNQTKILEGKQEPEEIVAISSQMKLVISSRLHLLKLSSINHVPMIGISRGSKVDNFLSLFGEESVGTTEDIDFKKLKETFDRLFKNNKEYREKSKEIVEELKRRAKQNEILIEPLIR